MNTLLKVYKYAKVGVAILFQIYAVTGYFPQVHTVPKSIDIDAATGFRRVKDETAKFLYLKQEIVMVNDEPVSRLLL